jgi:hypothetical protein
MAKINLHAGDFKKGSGSSFIFGNFNMLTEKHPWGGESISLKRLASIEVASEDRVKKVVGTVGWGAVGALALGPLGLLAGVLAGGNKKEVTFIAEFKDGRKLLATTDSKTFTTLKAAVF